jgi:translation elongation factor EF-G
MAVFEATMSLLQLAVRDGNLQLDAIFKFVRDTRQAEFLFDKPIVNYLETIRKNSVQFRYLNDQLHEERIPVGAERNRVAEEETKLLSWYLLQVENVASKQFRSYLSFHDVH